VIEQVGEARANAEVFSDLASRLGIGDAEEETDTLLRIAQRLPAAVSAELLETGSATPPFGGAPIQFVDVFPLTPDKKIDLFPAALHAEAPAGLYGYQPDPGTSQYPLALISPASEKSVSSTLAELRQRPAALHMHPDDARVRGLATDDPVRVFNDLGEVQCPIALNPDIRPGTVSLPKGLWRKSTYNGSTSNALVPDSLTDLGGGACFNDARVEVASLGKH
jgi:anaerobic selenocysteine-containing dehydrogenase